MKESITKFDLEAAFKALDEIDIPVADKVKANKPALTEIFSRKTKFDALLEEYYDVGSLDELDDAKDAREAEVAQAKLARIEKIVDLDAESPEDLLPSYVGKFIIQCPQCMTLFYKNPEDVEASEEDPEVVNIQEVCQHCGNEAGYTLIGKVGEATEEEAADFNQEETVDVASTEEGEEAPSDEIPEESSEEGLDINLDDLGELDLDIEDDEAEKAEESFNAGGGEPLVEELKEEAELDVSADEFEKLIDSPEFKKPISDTEARAMMDELDDEKEEVEEAFTPVDEDDVLSDRIEDMMYTGRFLYAKWIKDAPTVKDLGNNVYKVTHHLGGASVTVTFDTSDTHDATLKFDVDGKKFATKFVNEAQDFVIQELEAARVKSFDLAIDESCNTSEALEEGILDKLKDKVKDTVDNIASKLKSREAKADWLLANAMKDYSDIEVDTKGQMVPDKNNQRFKTFVVIGYTSRDNKGNLIKTAPEFDDKNLVVGKNGVQYKDKYEDADKIAKGWSMVQGNGPAFIYLANGKDDDNALFLCEYFMGELKNDQLEKYFKIVKDHLKGAKLMADGGMSNNEPEEQTAAGGETENTEYKGKYLRDNLTAVMDEVEDLQESTLEKLISDSLIESYGNVAGFRLVECSYENEKLMVDGTIYFTSGNKRNTSYVFTEAMTKDNVVSIRGLNEKLGNDKQFTITGYSDNKSFITESFKATKK
jgi:hypothetical protein